MEWNCGNGIAKIRGKKLFMSVCGNAIAEIGGKKFVAIVAMPLPQFHSTFFFLFFYFLRNDMCAQFLQQILSGRLLLLD